LSPIDVSSDSEIPINIDNLFFSLSRWKSHSSNFRQFWILTFVSSNYSSSMLYWSISILAKLNYNLPLILHCASLLLPGLVFLISFFIPSFIWCCFDSWQIDDMVPPICYSIEFFFINQCCVGHYIWTQLFWPFYSAQIEFTDIISCASDRLYFEIDLLLIKYKRYIHEQSSNSCCLNCFRLNLPIIVITIGTFGGYSRAVKTVITITWSKHHEKFMRIENVLFLLPGASSISIKTGFLF
jgi:hypothetical protein